MKKTIFGTVLTMAALAVIGGCKPTEDNYREAYDIAIQKKEQEQAKRDSLAREGINIFDDHNAPRWKKQADGDSVLYKREYLRAMDGDTVKARQYVVAVASYRMKTNARAQVSDLREKGYEGATILMNSKPNYYVVAASFDAEPDAVAFLHKFEKKNPKVPYVGLPDHPVVIDSGRR